MIPKKVESNAPPSISRKILLCALSSSVVEPPGSLILTLGVTSSLGGIRGSVENNGNAATNKQYGH